MRMSVSAILSKSGKEEMYRSKPTVDDQGSRGQSLPPIGQTTRNPPSPYTTFHSRSSSHPLIEDPSQILPRKLSHPALLDKDSSPADTKHRLVQGLLASAQPEQLPPTTYTKPDSPTAASNLLGSAIAPVDTAQVAVAADGTPSPSTQDIASNLGSILTSGHESVRRASLGNIITSHSPLLQQPYRRGSLDSGPQAATVKEEEDEGAPLRKPKLIIKNDLVWKSIEGKPEKSLGVFVYEPGVQLPVLEGQENATLEVRIPSWWLTYDNKMIRKRALWGTDIYTDDTDIVASEYM
jgi:hypothetical protein